MTKAKKPASKRREHLMYPLPTVRGSMCFSCDNKARVYRFRFPARIALCDSCARRFDATRRATR